VVTLSSLKKHDPASSNFKKVRQTAITICSWLIYPTGWTAQSFEDMSRCFYHARETLRGYNPVFIVDEYERVNDKKQIWSKVIMDSENVCSLYAVIYRM
jgi:hypothetical protein